MPMDCLPVVLANEIVKTLASRDRSAPGCFTPSARMANRGAKPHRAMQQPLAIEV